jgi:hemolysin D
MFLILHGLGMFVADMFKSRLIELDPTMTEAERDHLKSDLIAANLDIARLHAALAGNADPPLDFHPPQGAKPAQIEVSRQYLISQTAEQQAKLSALDRQIAQKQAERATTAATIAKIEATIPPLTERVEVRKYLMNKELGSKLSYLSDYQDLIGLQQEVLVQKAITKRPMQAQRLPAANPKGRR